MILFRIYILNLNFQIISLIPFSLLKFVNLIDSYYFTRFEYKRVLNIMCKLLIEIFFCLPRNAVRLDRVICRTGFDTSEPLPKVIIIKVTK